MQRRLQRRWRDRQTTQTPSGGRPRARLAVIPLFHAMSCRSCPTLRHRRIFCLYLLVCIYFSTPPHPAPSPPAALGHYHPCPSYRPLTLYRYKWFIFIFQIKYFHHCPVAACSALCYSRQLLRRQVMPSTPHGHPHPAPPYTALHLLLLPLLVLLSKNQLLFSLFFFSFFLILFLVFTITFYCGPSASIFTSVAAAASPLVFPRLQDIRRYCRYYSQLFSSLCFLSFVMSLIPAIGFVRCKSL